MTIQHISAEAESPFASLYAKAEAAAVEAVNANAHLESPHAFDCGFAWVEVRPATSPFIRWCKKNGHGDSHWKSGWVFWRPGGHVHRGQSIAVFEAGARAFAQVLKDHGIDAVALSRLD
jgi:hypothetical protein